MEENFLVFFNSSSETQESILDKNQEKLNELFEINNIND